MLTSTAIIYNSLVNVKQ